MERKTASVSPAMTLITWTEECVPFTDDDYAKLVKIRARPTTATSSSAAASPAMLNARPGRSKSRRRMDHLNLIAQVASRDLLGMNASAIATELGITPGYVRFILRQPHPAPKRQPATTRRATTPRHRESPDPVPIKAEKEKSLVAAAPGEVNFQFWFARSFCIKFLRFFGWRFFR